MCYPTATLYCPAFHPCSSVTEPSAILDSFPLVSTLKGKFFFPTTSIPQAPVPRQRHAWITALAHSLPRTEAQLYISHDMSVSQRLPF